MKIKNKPTIILLLLTLTTTSAIGGDGWGQKQTHRTIGGAITGGTIGGVIGHQSGKQKEGIIIGTVLGMLIGNQSGKGADYREEQQAWEARQREIAFQERLRREEQLRIEEANRNNLRYEYNSINHQVKSDEVTRAKHRAEQLEAELSQELEIRRIQAERRRALLEFKKREENARHELDRLKRNSLTEN